MAVNPSIERTLLVLLAAALLTTSGSLLAQPSATCRVEPFDGASRPEGAVTQMYVVNTGAPCSIRNFGGTRSIPSPAENGSITSKPAHGTAEFVAPAARYTPAPGYVGEDEFAYIANAKGTNGSAGSAAGQSQGAGRGRAALADGLDRHDGILR